MKSSLTGSLFFSSMFVTVYVTGPTKCSTTATGGFVEAILMRRGEVMAVGCCTERVLAVTGLRAERLLEPRRVRVCLHQLCEQRLVGPLRHHALLVKHEQNALRPEIAGVRTALRSDRLNVRLRGAHRPPISLTTSELSTSERSGSGNSTPSWRFSSWTAAKIASLNVACSRSLQKLMQSCSSELIVKVCEHHRPSV